MLETCSGCGAALRPGTKFCGRCGLRIAAAAPVAVPDVGERVRAGHIRILETLTEGPDDSGRYRLVTVFELAHEPGGALVPAVATRAAPESPPPPAPLAPSGWRVRLLDPAAHPRRRSAGAFPLIVMVVGQEARPWDRSALGDALLPGRSWRCCAPPGSSIPGGALPGLAADGKLSYRELKAAGDPAALLQALFPHLDGVFKVDASSRTIEEWELSGSSVNFFLKFDVLAKPERFYIELVEFVPA